MGENKNLSVVLPIELHSKFSKERENNGYMNNSEYLKDILTTYYDYLQKGEFNMSKENVKTLAIQITPELMERIKTHLKNTGMSQKAFLISIIEKELNNNKE